MEKESQKKRVIYKSLVETSEASILIGDLAKIIKQRGYDIGQNRLFSWLRENGYLIRVGQRRNLPTQKAMQLGLFEIEQKVVEKADRKMKLVMTTKVTEKGQKYFINKFQ